VIIAIIVITTTTTMTTIITSLPVPRRSTYIIRSHKCQPLLETTPVKNEKAE
jgi:hypothetical protein